MRRTAAAAVLPLLLVLAGCGGGSEEDTPAPKKATIDDISVTGDVGKKPLVDFKPPVTFAKTESKVVIKGPGKGDAITAGLAGHGRLPRDQRQRRLRGRIDVRRECAAADLHRQPGRQGLLGRARGRPCGRPGADRIRSGGRLRRERQRRRRRQEHQHHLRGRRARGGDSTVRGQGQGGRGARGRPDARARQGRPPDEVQGHQDHAQDGRQARCLHRHRGHGSGREVRADDHRPVRRSALPRRRGLRQLLAARPVGPVPDRHRRRHQGLGPGPGRPDGRVAGDPGGPHRARLRQGRQAADDPAERRPDLRRSTSWPRTSPASVVSTSSTPTRVG